MSYSSPFHSSPFIATEATSDTITTETRQQRLTRTGQATPRFLQGVFPFAGRGFFDLGPLNEALRYEVPPGRTAEVIYFRAGNLSDDLLYLALTVNGQPVRYFPVGPKADFHTRAGQVYAVQAECPHRNGPLADGLVGGTTVMCPFHSRKFDLTTGVGLMGDCDIQTYPIRLTDGGEMWLTV